MLIDKIFILQKKAIRAITLSPANTHTEPLFLQLKILPYQKIVYKQQLVFFHSIHNNYAPSSFANNWIKNSDRNVPHHLRNSDDYYVPPAKLAFFTRFPLYTLPKIWNNAGLITLYKNPTTFKIVLNEELQSGDETNRTHLPLPPNQYAVLCYVT